MRSIFPTTAVYLAAAVFVVAVGFGPVVCETLWNGSGENPQTALRDDSGMEPPEDPAEKVPDQERADEENLVEEQEEEPADEPSRKPAAAARDLVDKCVPEKANHPEPASEESRQATLPKAALASASREDGSVGAAVVAMAAPDPAAAAPLDQSRAPSTAKEPPYDSIDLTTALPEEAAAVYEELLTEGERLKAEGVIGPAYYASIPAPLIERLFSQGLVKLGVVSERSTPKTILVFPGGDLANPGEPNIAVDLRGFSARYIALAPCDGTAMVRAVERRFHQPALLTPGLLVRTDLDAVVLAVQSRTAARYGLELEDVSRTVGRFCIVEGLPFAYQVSSLITTDGRRIEVRATQARQRSQTKILEG
jgi:hypothetical protein